MKALIISAVVASIPFVVFAFASWDINPAHWLPAVRFFAAMFTFAFGAFAYGVAGEGK